MNSNFAVERKWTTVLFNPFVYVAGGKALGLGLAAILITAIIGAMGDVHFDGVLDMHAGPHASWCISIAEGIVDWLSLTAVLYLFGKGVSRTSFRAIDLFGTQAMARWPAIFIALVAQPPGLPRFGQYHMLMSTRPGSQLGFNTVDAIVLKVTAAIIFVLLAWMVLLMYKSYSVSCNVRGGKAMATFILGIVLGELVSKLAVIEIFKLI